MPSLPERRLGGAHRVKTVDCRLDNQWVDKNETVHPQSSLQSASLSRCYSCEASLSETYYTFTKFSDRTASLQFDRTFLNPRPDDVILSESNGSFPSSGEVQEGDDHAPVQKNTADHPGSSTVAVNCPPGLLRLFTSSFFTMDLALQYLFKSEDVDVQSYLTQRLFDFAAEDVNFYLLQLVSLYHNYPRLSEHLYPYFIHRCTQSSEFAIHLIWLLDTFSPCLRRDCSLRRTASWALYLQRQSKLAGGSSMIPAVANAGTLAEERGVPNCSHLLPHSESAASLPARTSSSLHDTGTATTVVAELSEANSSSGNWRLYSVESLRNVLLPLGEQQLVIILQLAAQRSIPKRHHSHTSTISRPAARGGDNRQQVTTSDRPPSPTIPRSATVSMATTSTVATTSMTSAEAIISQLASPTFTRHKRAVSDLTNLLSHRHRGCTTSNSVELANSHGCIRHQRLFFLTGSKPTEAICGGDAGGRPRLLSAAQVVRTQPSSLSSIVSRDSAVGLSRDADVGGLVDAHTGRINNNDSCNSSSTSDIEQSTQGENGQVNSLQQHEHTAILPNKSTTSRDLNALIFPRDTTNQKFENSPPDCRDEKPSTSSSSAAVSPSDSGLHLIIPASASKNAASCSTQNFASWDNNQQQQQIDGYQTISSSTTTFVSDDHQSFDLQLHLVPRLLPQWEFVDGLMRLARRLVPISSKEQRTAYLQAELANLNLHLPARVWLPVNKADHVVLRIPPTAAVCLNSKDKAPFLIYCEVLDCQDPWSTPLPHRSTSTSSLLVNRGASEVTATTSLTSLSAGPAYHWQSLTPSSLHSPDAGSIADADAVSTVSSVEGGIPAVTDDESDGIMAANADSTSIQLLTSKLELHDGTLVDSSLAPALALQQEPQATTPVYVAAGDIRNRLKQFSERQPHRSFTTDPEDPSAAVLKEPWHVKCQRIRALSPWGHLQGWRLTAAIVKVGDDLRQEQLAYQLLSMLQKIWRCEYVPLWLRPLTVIVTSADSGLIEPVPDTVSLHQIRRHARLSLIDYLLREHGSSNTEAFLQAQKNFVQSCAAYCLVSYLFQVKDRHNGNILLDNEGHMIHIDYGFILSASPGKNLGFEKSPFKLTEEQVAVMGGTNSDLFEYFKCLLLRGLLAARKHMDEICILVEIARSTCPTLPCFASGGQEAIKNLRNRFMLHRVEQQVHQRVNSMVEESLHSMTTKLYDRFQYYTNGIQY